MIAWLERNAFLVLGLAGLLILGTLFFRELTSPGEPATLVLRDDPRLEPGTQIRVHVAGDVRSPGVYTLAAGDRVEDAIAAAGGPGPGAGLDEINLARFLRDGEQVLVPGSGDPAARIADSLAAGEKLNINTATREQLMVLPGIGEAYSLRIVDSRLVDGPFESIADLDARGILPASTLEEIRGLISVSAP